MYLILFADDIDPFTTSPVSLQAQVDNLQQYSQKWGLKINVSKSRKDTYHAEIFINGHVIEQVDCFTYLGIKFHYTRNMIRATKALSNQALKAYYGLLSVFERVMFDIKTKLYLLDCMVSPILLYGSEIWGVYNFKDIEKHILSFVNLC